ncbi:MAG: hypothetical protein GEEBNDBF_01629 [bacterium]|nr:hypothetical protein [bacterium]
MIGNTLGIAPRTALSLVVGLVALGSLACTSGRSPMLPGTPDGKAPAAMNPADLPVLVSSVAPDGSPLAASQAIGAYDIQLDLESMQATLAPRMRSAQAGDPSRFDAVGDSLIVDVTEFFNRNPCGNCLRVDGLGINGAGEVLLTVGVRHPFDIPSALAEPEKRRFDLHVFDVAGVLLAAGTQEIVPGFNVDPRVVVNPEGYTSQVNSIALQYFPGLTAVAHPYKILSLDNEVGNYDPSQSTGWVRLDEPRGHNVLPMGSTYRTTTYRLRLPGGTSQINFGYVLTASYGFSAQGKGTALGQRAQPRYFLPEFHRKEAWKIETSVVNNFLVDNNPASSCEVQVRVWDWQHAAATMADPFDPATSPKDQVTRSSKIDRIELQVPDLVNSLNPKTAADFSGTGLYNDPVTTTFFVVNANLAGLGVHWGLVTVVDELDASTEEPQWLLKRPTDANPFPNFSSEAPIYRTYRPFIVPLTNGNNQPVASFTSGPFVVTEEESRVISGCASSDPDTGLGPFGDIVQYEWDLDWNGVAEDFNPQHVSAACAVNFTFGEPGDYLMGLRVTDGGDPALTSDPVGLSYTVLESDPPIATISSPTFGFIPAGTVLSFEASGVDPDAGNGPAGDLIDVAWDFEWDGIEANFVPDVTVPYGTTVNHAYLTTGAKTAGVRIRDGALPRKAGFDQVTLNITPAPAPPPTPVGNVTLSLTRGSANGGLPNSFRPNTITLDWADVSGEAEYAIYADYSPYGTGELLDDLVIVTILPANSITYSFSVPANRQLAATYVVRARSVANNVLSETANSQPAFIELDSFEPGSSDWIIGNEDPLATLGGNILETDKVNTGQGSITSQFSSGTVGFLQDFGSDSETRWSALVSPRLPDFPNIATEVQVVRIEAVHRGSGWPCNGISQAQYVFGIANTPPTVDAGNSNTGVNSVGRSYGRTSPTPVQDGFRATNAFLEGTDYNVRVGGTGPGAPCDDFENDVQAKGIGPFAGAPMVIRQAAGGDAARRGFAWAGAVVGAVAQADWLYSAFDLTADYKTSTTPPFRHAGVAIVSTANTTQTGILADLNFDDFAVIIY